MVRAVLVNVWRSIFAGKDKLQANFPWSTGKMLRDYLLATLLFLAGTLVPVLLFQQAVVYIANKDPGLFSKIFGLRLENMYPILFGALAFSFVCGFGLECWYLFRVFHRDGLRVRTVLGLNLDSLDGSWWKAGTSALITVVACIVVEQLVYLLPLPLPKQDNSFLQIASGCRGWALVGVAILSALICPFVEELVFRGVLFNMLRTSFRRGKFLEFFHGSVRLADWGAILVSSTIFAASHNNLHDFPGLLVIGSLLALVYRRTGSLIPCILAHCINNTIGLVVFFTSLPT